MQADLFDLFMAFSNGMATNRWYAIAWISDDSVHWSYMLSFRHNQLIQRDHT